MSDRRELGALVHLVRNAHGWDPGELADRLGATPGEIQAWITGRLTAPAAKVKRLRSLTQAQKTADAPVANGVPTAAEGLEGAWPRAERERCDFFHPPRTIPPALKAWRDQLATQLRDARNSRLSTGLASARRTTDLVAARYREISRLLAAEYGRPPASSSPTATRRVLRRLDIARHVTPLKTTQSRLVPHFLREELERLLARHGEKRCTSRSPSCAQCPLLGFCAHGRRASQARVSDDAPVCIDLFCGAGGLSSGLSRAGFAPVAALDSDEASLRTYAINHPAVPEGNVICGDVRKVSVARLKRSLDGRPLDLLAGAPPCQGFSRVGFASKKTLIRGGHGVRAESHHDTRNWLFRDMVRLARGLRPKVVLLENVPSIESRFQDSTYVDLVVKEFAALGYETTYWLLNASSFGVAQERKRVFVVASRLGGLPTRPVGEYRAQQSDFDQMALPPITLDEAIHDLPLVGAGEGEAVARWSRPARKSARDRRYLSKFGLRDSPCIAFNHTVRYHNDRDLELYALLRPGEDSFHALERGRSDLMRYRSEVFDDKYMRMRPDRPSKTIVAHLAKDGNGYIHPSQVRSISIREAARVQSFSDAYVFCGSPSDQWRQLGNAVPPLLAEAIGRSIRDHFRSRG